MTIYIVDIEPVNTRYTSQWKKYLPQQLKQYTNQEVVTISGGDVPQSTTPGAFLNFAGTNNYKSQQMLEISRLFANGDIKENDVFLYTDAWNPTVIQLKYMSELLQIPVKLVGLWHAGSYDENDFLGRLIGDAPWVRHAEKSMIECFDINCFATQFHYDMISKVHTVPNYQIIGWPMEYLKQELEPYSDLEKRDLILFPHRLAPEKQPDIFRDLSNSLPEYEFVICQEKELTKHEYHMLLGESKMIFSANLQETLGISWYEGLLVNSIPVVPDRLSYTEMAIDEFKYPSEWTSSFAKYQIYKQNLIEHIHKIMKSDLSEETEKQKTHLEYFFSGKALYELIQKL